MYRVGHVIKILFVGCVCKSFHENDHVEIHFNIKLMYVLYAIQIKD